MQINNHAQFANSRPAAQASPAVEVPITEERIAPRQQLVLRAAKLVTDKTECVCVVRDVSASGLKAKLFQPIPAISECHIEFANAARFPIRKVWEKSDHAGFAFLNPVDLEEIIKLPFNEYPKRGLRLNIGRDIRISHTGSVRSGSVLNISQNGICISCDEPLPAKEKLYIRCGDLPPLNGYIRWGGNSLYGIMLAEPLTLENLAKFTGKGF